MSTEKTTQDFKFESTVRATILPKLLGVILIRVSFEFLGGWLHPSWDRLPYLIILLPFGLFFWAVAGMMLYGYCHVQIRDGQFRFLRFFAWRSVPLESIIKAEFYAPIGMSVWLNYAGKQHWIVFRPDNRKFLVKLGGSPPPVIQFLREVCIRNAENSKSRRP